MESFYQMVNHQKLARCAQATGFPLPMLRLAVHFYRRPKHLLLGKNVAAPVIPNRGMPPGCSWACTLVKVCYINDFDEFIVRHPQVDLDVYVDDLIQSAKGTSEAVTTYFVEATEDITPDPVPPRGH
jgi:hypothetical protein